MQDRQHFVRGQMLLSQGRPELAEKELRQHLAMNPNDATGHAVLGLCLAQRDNNAEALTEAEAAIGLAPDVPFPHYVRALVLHDLDRPKDAESAAREAVRLDPSDADHHYILGMSQLAQRNGAAALESAETGLQLDPDHVGCNNLRAMALVRLGRKAEAGATIDATLRRDPNNAHSHANQGWTYLHRGEHRKALEHFREALRIEPDNEWARQGLVEALKAEYFIYRWMLAYYLWTARLSGKAQWAFIIGLYVGQRLVRAVARQNPELAPFLWPLIGLYLAFWLLTWIAAPLFNLLLRLNKFGRHALSREETRAANTVGLLIVAAVVLVGAALLGASPVLLLAALGAGLMIVPVSASFQARKRTPKVVLWSYTAALAVVGVAALTAALSGAEETGLALGAIFAIGFGIFQWVAVALKG